MTDIAPEQRIDAALDSVLRASGSALQHYTMPSVLDEMREAMRKAMSYPYIQGSNDCHKAMIAAAPAQPAADEREPNKSSPGYSKAGCSVCGWSRCFEGRCPNCGCNV